MEHLEPTLRAVLLLGAVVAFGCDAPPPEGEPLLLEAGEPCEAHDQCSSGLCLPSGGGLVCALQCQDEDECGPSTSCRLELVDGVGLASLCGPSNAGQGLMGEPCEADERCHTGLCHEGRCAELCAECGADQVCEAATLTRGGESLEAALCRWSLASPSLTLGPVAVGFGGSEELELEVPPGLASFTVVAVQRPPNPDQRVAVLSLVAPDGTKLLDFYDEAPALNPAANPYPGASAVLVPSTDAEEARPQPGIYRLRVGVFETDFVTFTPVDGEVAEVRVIFEPAGQEGGLLDLNLFFTPGTGLTAEGAEESDYIRTLLAQAMSYTEPSGLIRLGHVEYRDLPSEDERIDDWGALFELCQRSSEPGPHRASVNVFLVSTIGFTSGMAGGSPGPPGLFGTGASGIVIEQQDDASQTGALLGHELGHFLGLKHTTLLNSTEEGYQIVGADPISDTASCPRGVNIRDCPDYRNLMFPIFPFDGLSLTEGQLAVISGAPILYELTREGLCEAGDALDLTAAGFGAAALEASGGERPLFYHLTRGDLEALEVAVLAEDVSPEVVVRAGACDGGEELAREVGAPRSELVRSVEAPRPGWYFITVTAAEGDLEGAAGRFTAQVTEVEGG